jgi:hypothetical protein
MYGMVNRALESMVCKDYGEPTWEAIKKTARVDVEVFVNNQSYDDDVTYQLVAAASKKLNAPAATILEAFGKHWVLHTALQGYGELLRAGGKTLVEFMLNLPNFHNRVAMIYPNLRPPHFQCTDVTPTSLRLHYFSHRAGLESFVVGLMHGLGEMYGTPVTVELLESRANGAAHEVFLVTYPAS